MKRWPCLDIETAFALLDVHMYDYTYESTDC